MDSDLLRLAAQNGIWAVLFVGLLLYVLRTAKDREERLMAFTKEWGPILTGLEHRLTSLCEEFHEWRLESARARRERDAA